jgi:hypothetical protein
MRLRLQLRRQRLRHLLRLGQGLPRPSRPSGQVLLSA